MQKLIAYMNGELVGTLEKHKNGAQTFQYDKNWITNAVRFKNSVWGILISVKQLTL